MCESYFQDLCSGDLHCSQVCRRRTEAAPLVALLKFGHRVYIVISVCRPQTLLKSLLCLHGRKSEKRNWVYF